MLAIVAAICFAVGLLVDWAGVSSDFFNYQTLDTLGLLFIALHLAGFGASYDWRSHARGRGRRR
jgi:high-affinity Fe2+/Pb2+ permease